MKLDVQHSKVNIKAKVFKIQFETKQELANSPRLEAAVREQMRNASYEGSHYDHIYSDNTGSGLRFSGRPAGGTHCGYGVIVRETIEFINSKMLELLQCSVEAEKLSPTK